MSNQGNNVAQPKRRDYASRVANNPNAAPPRRGFGGPGGRGGGGGPMGFGNIARPKNTKYALVRLLGYFLSNKLMLLVVAAMLIISAYSSVQATYFLKILIDEYIIPGNFGGLFSGLVMLGGIYLCGILANFVQAQIMLRVAHKTNNTLRADMFNKMQALPLRYFDSKTRGEIMSRYTNDIDNISMALEQSMTSLASNIITFISTVVMMLVLNPYLTLISLGMLCVMLTISTRLAKRSRKNFVRQQAAIGNVNGYIEEIMEGQKVIKVFNHEKEAIEEFEELNEEYRQAAIDAQFYSGIIFPIMGNLNSINYALSATIGGIFVITSGNIGFTIGSLASFLTYSRQFGMPINQVTGQLNNILSALASAERVFELMDQQPEIDGGKTCLVYAAYDAEGALYETAQEAPGAVLAWRHILQDSAVQLIPMRADVRLNDVTFGYDEGQTVLKDVSVYAKPGDKIALVGSTGAGKTTITNLINRFYDVQQGEILFDGINVRDIKKDDLRSCIAMVLQDTHLFTGTVRENIRYGNLAASDEEIVEAARLANAHSFIRRLPNGYDTMIENDGEGFSQGQRQLIAIARAAVANPAVLILDEATSSIDTRTERLIERGMDHLMQNRTVFIIAHRLSTVRNSKAIMVIEDGEIIERGNHQDLLNQKGRYYELYAGLAELA